MPNDSSGGPKRGFGAQQPSAPNPIPQTKKIAGAGGANTGNKGK